MAPETGVDVSETASISSGIAQRYAMAVYGLAKQDDETADLARDVEALTAALRESEDLRRLIASPIYRRDDQGAAITAIADKMGLSRTLRNTLALMASKRRLFVLPAFLRALETMLAGERNEVTAEVASATPLSADQERRLSETLRAQVGKDVKLNTTVDESLIGGLVVKVGSRMIDTSIRSRLSALQNTMKEVR